MILMVMIMIKLFLVSSAGIDCFKCVSTNGSNPLCEDPFHNNYTSNILERPCMGGRKGRNGLFPASACIKVAGTYGKMTIRIKYLDLCRLFKSTYRLTTVFADFMFGS